MAIEHHSLNLVSSELVDNLFPLFFKDSCEQEMEVFSLAGVEKDQMKRLIERTLDSLTLFADVYLEVAKERVLL